MARLTSDSCPTLTKDLVLECYPKVSETIQQPWNAADVYLINHLNDEIKPTLDASSSVLIINDFYGALTCSLSTTLASELPKMNLSVLSDSFCSQQAIKKNLSTNQLELCRIQSTHEANFTSLTKDDVVLIQMPKSFDVLHYWLSLLSQQIENSENSPKVLLAGMSKHIPIKWLNWLEQHSARYQQYPQVKKSRLIEIQLPKAWPKLAIWKGYEYLGNQLNALPSVFSRDHLDIGSRFLLENLHHHQLQNISGTLIDLGCGNGLLSVSIANQYTAIDQVIGCDDSNAAVCSAEKNFDNWQESHPQRNNVRSRFQHTNVLESVAEKADWIVCNPPFHSGNRITTDIAQSMIKQSKGQLKENGKLLLIANRHLPYQGSLKKHFKKTRQIAANKKFVLYLCESGTSGV